MNKGLSEGKLAGVGLCLSKEEDNSLLFNKMENHSAGGAIANILKRPRIE